MYPKSQFLFWLLLFIFLKDIIQFYDGLIELNLGAMR